MDIKVKNLNKTYGNGFQAVKGIDLEIKSGDFFALLGPNGAGKSTSIGIISSLVNKTSGSVKIGGFDIDKNPAQAKALLGIVPQEINLNIFEKPMQILLQQANYYGVSKKVALPRAEELLKKMELWEKRGVPVRMFSGGMKRRLMIARALIHDPKILILDEPTAGVDIEIRQSMWEFFIKRNREGLTIVLTTHYLEEAEDLCNKIAIINHGEIVANTSMSELLDTLESETVVLYLEKALDKAPVLDGFNCTLVDGKTLEVGVRKEELLTDIFCQLAKQKIMVSSMRNKSNRLERLFMNLVNENNRAAK